MSNTLAPIHTDFLPHKVTAIACRHLANQWERRVYEFQMWGRNKQESIHCVPGNKWVRTASARSCWAQKTHQAPGTKLRHWIVSQDNKVTGTSLAPRKGKATLPSFSTCQPPEGTKPDDYKSEIILGYSAGYVSLSHVSRSCLKK